MKIEKNIRIAHLQVQGMSYLAALFLLQIEGPDAFISFANLLNRPLQQTFYRLDSLGVRFLHSSFPLLHSLKFAFSLCGNNLKSLGNLWYLYILQMKSYSLAFELLLTYLAPTLGQHLSEIKLTADIYLTDWYHFLYYLHISVYDI